MVTKRDRIINKIKKLKEVLKKNGFKIDRIYLFGSYASEKAREDSDIDVAVISKDFCGNRFKDSLKLIHLKLKIDNRLEIIPYRPENFNVNDPLVCEIKKSGIEI